jgi:hypothetical protein
MNKNILKIWALALGLFSFGILFTNAQQEWEVSLTINAGTSSCSYGTSLDLGSAAAVIGIPYTFSGDFTESFECVDYRGTAGAWTMTMQSSALAASGIGTTIPDTNVKVYYGVAIASGNILACTGDGAGVAFAAALPLDTPQTLLQRMPTVEGVCSVALESVGLRVDVPANQAPGIYTGTITLTIPNFS